jgi:hypothetical protein
MKSPVDATAKPAPLAEDPPAEPGVIALDEGRILASPAALPVLRANQLDSFNRVMACQGFTMRAVPGRSTIRLDLAAGGTRPRRAFLKRYEPQYLSWWRWPLRALRWPGCADEALHEWRMIHTLRAHGFHTPLPLAVGQHTVGGLVTRSFVLTAEIEDGIAAHEYLRALSGAARRAMVRRIAELTRRFHQAGFVHKDYYLNHILIVAPPGGVDEPKLFLIDLQRVRGPGRVGGRWLVKDLAALIYSAQLVHATRSDLLAFYKTCLGRPRLDAHDKRFIRRILTRVDSLHRRQPKYDVIWDQPGARPPNV